MSISRRRFMQGGGALWIAFHVPGKAFGADSAADFAPNAYLRIDPTGQVTITVAAVEMGQGVYTSIPMLIAEELEIDLDSVRVEHAPPNERFYGNPYLGGIQATGNSNAIRGAWEPMRRAGAVARTMLVQAAAQQWRVEPAACRAEKGAVIHTASGKRLNYGALVQAASALPVPGPGAVTLKRREQFALIGTPARRTDLAGKTNGTAVYGIDVNVPGMKVATLAISPTFGGRLRQVDDAAASGVSGVRQIVRLDDAVAVVADHMWAAKKGLAALKIEWDDGENAQVSSASIVADLEKASGTQAAIARQAGDFAGTFAQSATRHEAVYQAPFLAHAALEPMNCTVHVRKDGCEVWVGTQIMSRAQSATAKVTGLPVDKVTVHNHLLGGGFGRRLEVDGIVRAVQVAKQVDGPVKVIYTREEDIQHDVYRPYFYDRLSAGLDAQGLPVAWRHRITGSSILARWAPPLFKNGLDPETVDGAVEPPYALPNLLIEYVRYEPPGIPTTFWRGVGPAHNIFMVESFIDELAHVAHKDPVAYRRGLLQASPRARAVLDLAAEKAGWGQPLAKGVGRGVSVQHAFGSYLAQVADVEVAPGGEVRVRRVVCAVDCGVVVNPDTVRAQMQGGTAFGVSAALREEVTLQGGRVQQTNFADYPVLRMNEMPSIDVYFVDSGESPGGIGETATACVMPAITNAVFAATGKRIRKLPIASQAAA
jgi:CO/xanthine dehydrogenase Mo-binding subunit